MNVTDLLITLKYTDREQRDLTDLKVHIKDQ